MPLPGYSSEIPLTIDAPSGLSAGAVVRVTGVETRSLIASGSCRPDRKDFRVTYNGTEIDRVMITTGSFAFRLQADIASGGSSTDYAISHGNPTETTDPKENPRNVWPAYLDGDDIASFTTTGSVTTPDAPAPGLIKVGANPTLMRAPGTGDFKNVREVELFYEDGWFYATYDADDEGQYDGHVGWTSYLARSRDLLTWEKLGEVMPPGGGGADSASASDVIIHKFPGLAGYFATYLGTNVLMGTPVASIPMPPYTLHGATADSVTGPWTKTGVLIPRGAGGTFDDGYNVDGVIFTLDGGTTYKCVYGAYSSNWDIGNTAALATAPHPLGPWTKIGPITDYQQRLENPRILFDEARGIYYLIGNVINLVTGAGSGTRSNVLYWSNDLTSFRGGRTALIEPDTAGGWDSFAIGLASTPVIKDGMIYFGYDGADYANFSQSDGSTHKYRDGGFAEARWPFRWSKHIAVPSGGTAATSAPILSGDGEVHVRCRFTAPAATGSQGVALEGGGESFRVGSVPQFDEIGWLGDDLVPYVNGVEQAHAGEAAPHSFTLTFRRSGGTLKILWQGWEIYGGSSSAPLALKAYGDTIVEEARVEAAGVTVSTIVDADASDSTTSTDSTAVQVISPANATAADGASQTDSATCRLIVPASVATPFLLAASFLVAVLYDTATADTGAFSDVVSIARPAVQSDATTAADSSSIAVTCAVSDVASGADSVGATVGAYGSALDTTSVSDSVGALLVLRASGADATTQTDSSVCDQAFPETLAITDSTASEDSTLIVAAIGAADGTSSSDVAYGYVGLLASAVDSTTTADMGIASGGVRPAIPRITFYDRSPRMLAYERSPAAEATDRSPRVAIYERSDD